MDIQPQTKLKILLIGDNGLDQYQYGTVDRISPEAPVPVINYTHTVTRPGMAANVLANLEKLGCDVVFLHGVKTCVKTRVIDSKSKQHLLRIDQDQLSNPVKLNQSDAEQVDAIVISDYNKGTVDYNLITHLIKTTTVPIFIDTKKTDLAQLNGCYIKINTLEHSRATSLPDPQWLIVTHGGSGAEWNNTQYPAESVGEVIDVCGAGDTFLAALVYKFLETGSMSDAIMFANRASAVTVQQVGVYAPGLEEIV